MDGIFSVKSDVFSFGVLVLEIVSGKRNRGVYHSAPQLNLLGYVSTRTHRRLICTMYALFLGDGDSN